MGGLLGDDDAGGPRPQEPEGLPGFPAEWGRIVIPDDASELDRDSAKVRRSLRRHKLLRRYQQRTSQRFHHLALPLILVTMAVLVTTTSLFAAIWPTGHTRTNPRESGTSASDAPDRLQTGRPAPALRLTDPAGQNVPLNATHPAVVLLLRHCACAQLITDTSRAIADARVPLLVVGGRQLPVLPSLPANAQIRSMTDPSGALANAFAANLGSTPDSRSAAALLIDQRGLLVRVLPATHSATDFAAQLPALVG